MSYTPTSWTTGDTITASALNKIEQGIANAGGGGGGTQITATMDQTGLTLDASYNELKQILLSGSTPFFIMAMGDIEQDGYEDISRNEILSVSYGEGEDPAYPYLAASVMLSTLGAGMVDTVFKAANDTDDMFMEFGGGE